MGERTLPCDFVSSGFFALRTPLLPFDELLAWSDGLEAATTGADPARWEADRARLRARLQTVFKRPEAREAHFVASPDLEERFDLWLREPDSEQGQKIERALVRYFARMAGRATPFGLFAGCSVGTLGTQTVLALAERACYRRHTRLDMDYLVLLTDALAREPALRPALSFAINSSLYPARGRFRYCEVRRNGKGWTHHQVALEATDYLEATLTQAGEGIALPALAAALIEKDPEASQEEAEDYLNELIANQVLVSELRPAVTGPEPLQGLALRLRERTDTFSVPPHSPKVVERGRAEEAIERLEQASQELEALDAGGLGAEPSRYRDIAGMLISLPGELDLSRLFQVDQIKPVRAASLGAAVLDEIVRGVRLLRRLARRPREDHLARFREAFAARYEGREVPLVEALDEDTGVGFGTLTGGTTDASSLLDGLTFPEATEEKVPWGKRETVLLGLLNNALAGGAGVLVLDEDDVEQLAEPNPLPLPDAFAALATVAAASETELAHGNFQIVLHGTSGPSGARLLGRFCHADPRLHQLVEQHVRAEEALQPDAVFAEIVHLPKAVWATSSPGRSSARTRFLTSAVPVCLRSDKSR